MLTAIVAGYFLYREVTNRNNIASVITSLNTIYNTTKNVFSSDILEMDNYTNDIDFAYKLKMKEKFLLDLSKLVNQNELNNSEAVQFAILSINESLDQINIDLERLKTKIIRHKNKWLYKVRKLKCKKEILNLKNHIRMMDERYYDLINLIKIICLSHENKNSSELVTIFKKIKN